MDLNIKIKGRKLWMLCAVLVIGIVAAGCDYFVDSVEQPASAVAGTRIQVLVKPRVTVQGDPWNTPIIFGFCVPRGWKVKENNLKVSYIYDLEGGPVRQMTPVADNELATNGDGLTWVEAFKKQYGNGGNFVDDI